MSETKRWRLPRRSVISSVQEPDYFPIGAELLTAPQIHPQSNCYKTCSRDRELTDSNHVLTSFNAFFGRSTLAYDGIRDLSSNKRASTHTKKERE